MAVTCHPPQPNDSPQWKSITTSSTMHFKGNDNGYSTTLARLCVCVRVGVCLRCRFCSTRHTTLGSLVLPVINTGLKSPTVTRLPYCLFCPGLNNELDPPSNAVVTLFVASHYTQHTHTHTYTCAHTGTLTHKLWMQAMHKHMTADLCTACVKKWKNEQSRKHVL